VPTARRDEAIRLLREAGLGRLSHVVGKTNDAARIEVWRDAKAVFGAPLRELHQAWDEVSWRIARLRDNPACADAEHEAAGRDDDPGCTSTAAGSSTAERRRSSAPGRRSRSCASRASTATSS
jgi:phosphoribosylformylglycinamidine synthase